MKSRTLAAAVSVSAALVLTACSSSTAGKNVTDGASTGPGVASSSTGGAPSVSSTPTASSPPSVGITSASPGPAASSTGAPAGASGLAALIKRGSLSVKSAHIALRISAAGQNITGSGDQTLANGKLVGFNLRETLPGGLGSLQLIIVGGKTYAKLPAKISKSSKPWALVTPRSSNPTIRQIASSLQQTKSSASVGSVSAFASAARTVTNKGPKTVGGVATTHYFVVVDPAKLPSDNPARTALAKAGVKALPVDLYIDAKGRPVYFSQTLSVLGQKVSTSIAISKYNQPVAIKPPPANQIVK